MNVQSRHLAIVNVLKRKQRMDFDRLQTELGVSRSTLRRDLIELEHLGDVVRQRGVVLHPDFVRGEPTFDRRRAAMVEQKKAIAARAARDVPENASVYLDAGTTCLEVGRILVKREDLRIFTHSIRLLSDSTDAAAKLVCVGGEYRRVSDALVGGLTSAWLEHLNFDSAFVAASGLTAQGLSTTDLSEAAVKQQILRRARRRILVADSSKWNNPAAVTFAGWGELTDFVCDAGLPPDARNHLKSTSIQLQLAGIQ